MKTRNPGAGTAAQLYPILQTGVVDAATMNEQDVNVQQTPRTTHVQPHLPLALRYTPVNCNNIINIGYMINSYMHCNVLNFTGDANSLCCGIVKSQLTPIPDPPQELRAFSHSKSVDTEYFF